MSRDLEGAVLLVLGTVLARITLEGSYTAYVKTNLFWPLVLTSAVLLFLGIATLRRDPSTDVHAVAQMMPDGAAATTSRTEAGAPAVAAAAAEARGTGGDETTDEAQAVAEVAPPPRHSAHVHGPPRLGILLLAPVLVLVLMAPPPLGAFAADRGAVNSIAQEFADELPPLERDGDEPVALTISEFVLRTLADGTASIEGVPVRLTGFVAADEAGFRISRFAIACCAADASPRQVRVVEGSAPVGEDEWVEAVVVWDGRAAGGDEQRVPDVRVVEVRGVDAPTQPYEYAVY